MCKHPEHKTWVAYIQQGCWSGIVWLRLVITPRNIAGVINSTLQSLQMRKQELRSWYQVKQTTEEAQSQGRYVKQLSRSILRADAEQGCMLPLSDCVVAITIM